MNQNWSGLEDLTTTTREKCLTQTVAKYFRTPDQSYKSAIALNCKHLRLTRIWVLNGNKLALWLIVIRLFIYKYIDWGFFFGRKPSDAIALIRESRKCTNWVRYSPLAINGPNMIEVMMVQNKPQKKHIEKSHTLKRRSTLEPSFEAVRLRQQQQPPPVQFTRMMCLCCFKVLYGDIK